MNVDIDISSKELEGIIKNLVKDFLQSAEGKRAIRAGVSDYLMKYNLFEFTHLLKKK